MARELVIERIATYALSRENREKTITARWELSKGKLLGVKLTPLSDFVKENMALLFSMPEVSVTSLDRKSHSAIRLQSALGVTKRRAVLTAFEEEGEEFRTIQSLRVASEVDFFKLSEKVAGWFKETSFWPKTYLFIVQALITYGKFSTKAVAILASRLEYGDLAEHEETVVEQIKGAVIRRRIRKGMIYPHVREKNGKLGAFRRAKV